MARKGCGGGPMAGGRAGGRRWWAALVLVAVCVVLAAPVARADAAQARLTLQKLRGAEVLGRVAGTFEAAVEVPEGARLVTFYIDGRLVGWATTHPYTFRFDTRDYPIGAHRIEAVVHLADGTVATSNSISLDFRAYRWHLVVRQSMFLYAATLLALAAVAGLVVHRLLHIRPRLVLSGRTRP